MKKWMKRVTAAVLCLALTLTALPASGLTVSADSISFNEGIMEMLLSACGSEEEAEAYYTLLTDYGFLDESGNIVSEWDIILDGEKVSAEEVREILDDPDCDMTRTVTVDGTVVTMEDLSIMIAIEDVITYLDETYYTETTWTARFPKLHRYHQTVSLP